MEEPEELPFQFLREITDGFSEKRKVGQGGFGTVYKGVTKTGEDVAVKIPRYGGKDLDYRQFRNEFYNLTKVKHDNIVQFLGYCCETERTRLEYDGRIVLAEETHRALCFEYLHNGSLRNYLSDESCGLDWHTRYKIIKGTCEGLRYIHEEESLLHLDLKPDNILLDKNMLPKIGDFGLSKIFGDELTRTTQSPLGTLGYQPPEYIEKKEISKKFDIFSLGVVIVQIVSGEEAYKKCQDMASKEFIDLVQRNWRKRWQATCGTDSSFEECCCQVKTCTQIALDCLEKDSQKRHDIVEIINKLNKIETGINEPPLQRCKTVRGMIESGDTQETSFDGGKELILGREEKKNGIVSSLESMSEKIVILPIYGIGGIGKTTFARLIYNDKKFKYYSHVWIYVSTRFDLCKIGNSIISQLSGKENEANKLQEIKSCLTKLLSGKKILIVLDNIWENNTIQLADLKDMLSPGDSIKTVVIVTTRSAHIAQKICSNIEPYKIEFLTDEICWDIIKGKSGFEAVHDNEKLVGIGKEIARKCRGVALAAQTLGSMLQSRKYDEWITVKDSDIWNETFSDDTSLPNHVLASLKLSYTFSMDDCLKSCFTYCAIFPKGHQIVKCDLTYQWISLGFIKPTKMFSTLQLCEKYIARLLGLTFLQHSMSPRTYPAYGEHDTMFTMHDLVYDLAISLLGGEILDQSKEGNTGGRNCRYALLTDCSKPLESFMTSTAKLSTLRLLDCRVTELHAAAFEPVESLRVLDLSNCLIHKLPDSIGRLNQLRYLNAPRIRDRTVPECITNLLNLSYLILRGSCGILALPESIGEMEGLVHLDFSGCLGIKRLPESFGMLTSLEHMDFADCKNVTGVSKCLASLSKLQHLNLSNCKNIGDLPRALGSLTQLQFLNLSDSSYLSGNELKEAEFLGSLTKLKYLNLSSINELGIIIVSPEALGNLTELEYLNLSHDYIVENKLATSLGNLRNLVHLDMSYCHPLRGVPVDLDVLPDMFQYRELIRFMEELEKAFRNLTELRHLNLGSCIREEQRDDKISDRLLEQICTLTNLEYLNLCENSICSMPEVLGNLRKLHTLDLSSSVKLHSLPASISDIDSLKFLYTKGCWKLDRSTLRHYTSSSRIPPHCMAHTGDDESSSYLSESDHGCPGWRISRLENVKSAKEAQKIKLMNKTDITQLALEWTSDAERLMDDRDVLTELQPPYTVSEFHLEGYNSDSFPDWVMVDIDTYLSGLTRIKMWDLPSCKNLPPLGQLPNLMFLEIRRMDSIKKIDMDLYGGTSGFPQLEQFTIDRMKCLEEWNMAYSSDEDSLNEALFPCLDFVEIRHCPRLRFKPHPPRSIKTLLVDRSDEVILSSWGNRGHVSASATTSLRVESCVVPLHWWSLLGHLPYLRHLEIINCRDLTCSSPDFFRCVTSLQTLAVRRCESIMWLPERLGDITSLTELEIEDCKGIKTLPDSIQKLTCLQTLAVRRCESIVSLSERFGDLAFLKELEINDCKGMKTLPDSIQHLTRLQLLQIYRCPELIQWCRSKEHKMKLAHIKNRFYGEYDTRRTRREPAVKEDLGQSQWKFHGHNYLE